jgi:putative endonuclease
VFNPEPPSLNSQGELFFSPDAVTVFPSCPIYAAEDMSERHCYVSMMMSSSRRASYTGVTNNLERRVLERQTGTFEGFSDKYSAHRLVWFERHDDVRKAIDREKQIKRWRREKKEWLIDRINPNRHDLSSEWGKPQDYVAPIFFN